MRFILLFGLGVLSIGLVRAQIVVSQKAVVSAANNPDIVMVTNGDVRNGSDFDFSGSRLHLSLFGTNQIITGNISAMRLRVDGGGTITVNNSLHISSELHLLSGYLQPASTGKILFTGTDDGLVGGSDDSYVNGPIFRQGPGRLKFPIGLNGLGYAPAVIENAPQQEVGMEVLNEDPSLSPASTEVELAEIEITRYWLITAQDIASLNSAITLGVSAGSLINQNLTPVIVQADATGGDAYNIGSSVTNESSITSALPVSRPIVTVGGSERIDIRIHDMISPFTADDINDQLYIENINKFPTNKVTLLDRWGVVVKEWKNFTNYNDPVSPNSDPFNFTRLSPGNYICVVEFSNATQGTQKKSQMITVLKIK